MDFCLFLELRSAAWEKSGMQRLNANASFVLEIGIVDMPFLKYGMFFSFLERFHNLIPGN